ncbi:MAG: YjbH domain-containing protein [Bacteroidales bacterium]
MTAQGFENVFAQAEADNVLQIRYENRRYRFEPYALARVLEIVGNNFNSPVILHITVLHQTIPMVVVQLPLQAYLEWKSGAISLEQFSTKCRFTMDTEPNPTQGKPANPSFYKPDLVVIPNWRAQFGDFDRPVQSNINLIPEVNLLLGKGLSVNAQLIIPVQYNFLYDDDEHELRPGNITINQLIRLKDEFFVSATAGFFNLNRAGVNLELKKYFAEGKLAIGTNVGLTRYHSFTGREALPYETSNFLTAFLTAEYRHLAYDLTGRIQAGNFLYNDPGVRFEVLRQFGEVQIGFFALINTKEDLNGGFNFSIPIPPRKYSRIKYFRIRPSEAFSWEYRAKGFPTSGIMYKTGHQLFDLMLEFNPDYMKKRFLIELNNK